MPELPEVQMVVDYLSKKLPKKVIHSIQCPNQYEKVFNNGSLSDYNQNLQNKIIQEIWRRGKFIVIKIESQFLLIHLRMTGQLTFELPNLVDIKYVSIKINFDDNSELFFRDIRKFGRVYLLNNLDWLENKLGIEPLSNQFTPNWLYKGLNRKKRMMKPLLLDQSFIVGLGNIYVDEILWETGIYPTTSSNTINKENATVMHNSIQTILRKAISFKGTTIINFTYGENNSGNFSKNLQVFGKEGKPCSRCGNAITKIMVAQRGTHFCNHCQK